MKILDSTLLVLLISAACFCASGILVQTEKVHFAVVFFGLGIWSSSVCGAMIIVDEIKALMKRPPEE